MLLKRITEFMLVFCNVIDNIMMALILGLAQMSLKMLGLHGENASEC